MDDEKFTIKNVKAEYITTKTDKYENEICYFKMRDRNLEAKFAPLMKNCPGLKQIRDTIF